MKYYASWNHAQFVLCLGYKGRVIKDFFLNLEAYTTDFTLTLGSNAPPCYHGDPPERGWEITLADTGLDTMTGGRVKAVQKYVESEDDFFLTYGDGVGDVDLDALLDFHRSHGKVLTVTGVYPPGRFGELEYSSDHRVTGFNEKPQVSGGRISAGFFACKRELLDYIPARADVIFEREPIKNIVDDGELMIYEHNGFWQPMDTSREYQLLNELWRKGTAPWQRW
jgi:glucose-1-phosphate cytidylyltransferase